MSPEPEAWQTRLSLHYLEQIESRRYRHRLSDIDKRLDVLLQDPYGAARAERLKHDFTGLRSARMFEATRLIYRLCEECRTLGEQDRLPLDCCADEHTPARTVNVLCLSEHYADMPAEFEFDD